MVDVFYTKYFLKEETVTLATLQGTMQRSNEDLMEYIKSFRDIAFDYYDHYEEKTLVEMCMGNMIMEYRAILKNLEIFQLLSYYKRPRRWPSQSRPALTSPRNEGLSHKP